MSITQKLIYAFWIFVGIMVVWEFCTYNSKIDEQEKAHPEQKFFLFLPPTDSKAKKDAAAASKAHLDGADVQQVAYSFSLDTPSIGTFTAHVTVKNLGNAKAVGVQVRVRPYRGASNYNEDVGGNQTPWVLSDDDPISKQGAYLSFPDLAPGESSTQDVTFTQRSDLHPGPNPTPTILFETDKSSAKH